MNPVAEVVFFWAPLWLFAVGASYPLWGIPLYVVGNALRAPREGWGRLFVALGCLALGGQLLAIILMLLHELLLRWGMVV